MTAIVRGFAVRYLALPVGVRAVLPMLWMGLLWWSSSRPLASLELPWTWSLLRNGAHVVAFGVLGLLLWLLLGGGGRRRTATTIVLASIYAIVDEVHQSFVPGRVASVADSLSDGLGAALACCWLDWRLQGDLRARALLPWLVLGALASVAAATWLGW